MSDDPKKPKKNKSNQRGKSHLPDEFAKNRDKYEAQREKGLANGNAFRVTGQRDKDNADHTPAPTFSRRPAPNQAPRGSAGETYIPGRGQPALQLDSILKNHPTSALLTTGKFISAPAYSFAMRIDPYSSPGGINGGSISELEIQRFGIIIAQYRNAQWRVQPEKEMHLNMVQYLRDHFDPPEKDREQTRSETKENARSWER